MYLNPLFSLCLSDLVYLSQLLFELPYYCLLKGPGAKSAANENPRIKGTRSAEDFFAGVLARKACFFPIFSVLPTISLLIILIVLVPCFQHRFVPPFEVIGVPLAPASIRTSLQLFAARFSRAGLLPIFEPGIGNKTPLTDKTCLLQHHTHASVVYFRVCLKSLGIRYAPLWQRGELTQVGFRGQGSAAFRNLEKEGPK